MSQFSVKKPPFGLDYERDEDENEQGGEGRGGGAGQEAAIKGFRKGGPKEARLFRVALLASSKDVDHLHPVRVRNIPTKITEEALQEQFSKFGQVGDVYVPRNSKTREAIQASGGGAFAVVRFTSREAAQRALEIGQAALPQSQHERQARVLELEAVRKQESVFSSNSGAMGITNEVTDEMRKTETLRNSAKAVIKQNITLDQCLSRSGYPWGSKQELKILEPHAPREVMDMYSIKLEELDRTTTEAMLREAFAVYGDVGDVYCPKPLHVKLRTQEPNSGIGFVRFRDRRYIFYSHTHIHTHTQNTHTPHTHMTHTHTHNRSHFFLHFSCSSFLWGKKKRFAGGIGCA